MEVTACNYDQEATIDDGSCQYPEDGFGCDGSCLDLNQNTFCDIDEQSFGPVLVVRDTSFNSGPLNGYHSYIVYLELDSSTDELIEITGIPDALPFQLQAPWGCWDPLDNSFVLGADNPSTLWNDPSGALYEYDTFWTIGMLSSDELGALPDTNYNGNSIVAEIPGSTGPACNLAILDGGMRLFASAANAVAGDDHLISIARVTTDGDFMLSGNARIWLEGESSSEQVVPFQKYVFRSFGGCSNSEACNYDALATFDDGTCEYPQTGLDCFGNCSSDEDADGVCDNAEILGCTFAWACNYDPIATEDDGSCSEICEGCTVSFACNYDSSANVDDGSCVYSDPGFDCAGNCWDLDGNGQCDDPWNNLLEGPVVVELDTAFTQGELAGYRSFLVYLEMDNATDVLSAIWSDTIVYDWTERLQINAPLGCWNPLDESVVMDQSNASVLWEFPEFELREFDTFWTIGMLSSDAEGSLPFWVSPETPSAGTICESSVGDGIVFVTGNPVNAFAGDDHRVVMARVTTPGAFFISGNAQVFPGADSSNEQLFPFRAFVNPDLPGCNDENACNYDEFAWVDDGSCWYPPEGYDCEENCLQDEDGDGICDPFDDCLGSYDGCGICNGPGAIYECGCDDIAEGYCDCAFNVVDAVGECGGDCIGDFDGDGVCDCFEESTGGGLFIPDDVGSCFFAEMEVVDEPEEAGLSALHVNMEHSYLGDLVISFICPNGQSLTVHQQGGGSTFLGIPVDNDMTPDEPGIGFDYSWSPNAQLGTWVDEVNGGIGESLAPGTYTSLEPWSNLEGCPVNGTWTIEICDLLGSDNGFLFDWGIQLDGQDLYSFGSVPDCSVGCTDAMACNYNEYADEDDGSCLYPGDSCDDGDDSTSNDIWTEDCECLGSTVGVGEAGALSWTLYPTPVRDVLNLRLEGAGWGGDVEAVISSATGQALRLERLAGPTQLDVHELAPGVYFLTLRSPAMAATTRRFVVGTR
jgi:subtilisin-like proprotein convertase family protein